MRINCYLYVRRNIILLYHKKIISHDPLQNIYPNLAGTCKNKFYENKIILNSLHLLKNYYGITDCWGKVPVPPRVR